MLAKQVLVIYQLIVPVSCEVATKMWQEYDFRYYQKNKSKMLQPQDVAIKISEMIFDAKTYKNGDSIEMYSNNI